MVWVSSSSVKGGTPPHLAPEGTDASLVSEEITRLVALPTGQRPFRVHIDPANDGSQEVSTVADRVRREFLSRVDLADLLTTRSLTVRRSESRKSCAAIQTDGRVTGLDNLNPAIHPAQRLGELAAHPGRPRCRRLPGP